MEIIDCNEYKGWYAGNFYPNLVKSKDIEFGFKRIAKCTEPDYHYHKIKTEFTILIEGILVLSLLSIVTFSLWPVCSSLSSRKVIPSMMFSNKIL